MSIFSLSTSDDALTIEHEKSQGTVSVDEKSVTYRSPAIYHKAVGICLKASSTKFTKDLYDRYQLGFIQYVEEYSETNWFENSKTYLEFGVTSDAGLTPISNQKNGEYGEVGFPWYRAPQLLNKTREFRGSFYFDPPSSPNIVSDAPGAQARRFAGSSQKSNPLEYIEREQRFCCWLVVWDTEMKRVELALGRSIWDHKTEITVDAKKGTTLVHALENKVHKLEERPEKLTATADSIPKEALSGPTANKKSETGWKSDGQPRLYRRAHYYYSGLNTLI